MCGSERRTTDIVIERNGRITERPPLRMAPEQVDATVLSKRLWIYRNLAEWQDLNAVRITREWVNGESFLYLGSGYRLQLVPQQDEPLKLKDGRFCLLRSIVEEGGKEGAHCLMAPLTVIDYIVVHELCHMHHRDHSEAFWNEVDKVLPDYRSRMEWLRSRGAALDL